MTQEQTAISFPFPASPNVYHPSPELIELSRSRPVSQVTLPDGKTAWLVTSYASVRQVLTDPRFSRAAATTTPDVSQSNLSVLATDSLINMDPPEHSRLRRLVAHAFTARRVEQLRPRITSTVDELLDRLQDLPQPVDLVEHFSLPLPVRVICEMLGVPASDQENFHAWSDAIMVSDWGGDLRRAEAAMVRLRDYFTELIAAKRSRPADDLVSALIAARDDEDRLSESELVTMCLGLLIAGHETTANQINMFLLTLLHFPEELARLRADPDTIPRAVEELMRFVQLSEGGVSPPRITTEDVTLDGVTIPAHCAVIAALEVANRDPAVFAQPDRLDLSRHVPHHLAFGAGAHHCLGAQLARAELQEALHGLMRRMPNVRLAVPDDQLRYKHGMLVRSLESLPVSWDVPETNPTSHGAADLGRPPRGPR